MAILPEVVQEAFKDKDGPAVFATVDDKSIPNIIYVGCLDIFNGDTLFIADNYFSKTRANISAGSSGSLLFITKERKAYQIKGSIEYHEEGEVFDAMKKTNPQQHPGRAAAVLKVEEVYCGSEKLA